MFIQIFPNRLVSYAGLFSVFMIIILTDSFSIHLHYRIHRELPKSYHDC